MTDTITNPFGEIYGYARVSTAHQHEDRQMIALVEYGVPENMIFLDKKSGKNFNRPAYKRLIRVIRKGDIIVIKSIDRLGRNYQDILDQWKMITQDIGCGIHVLDMAALNTSGDYKDLSNRFISDMLLQVLSFVAQNEREATMNRQREGIKAAREKRNVKIGRPKKPMPFDFWEIFMMYRTGEYKSTDLWRFCHEVWGMSNRTFYRRINELNHRYDGIPNDRLRDLILDPDYINGIDWENERIERGIGYYNSYALTNPEKDREYLERKKRERELMTEEELNTEEIEIRKHILAKRQQTFRDRFGIIDNDEAAVLMQQNSYSDIEPLPTKLIRKKPHSDSFKKLASKHMDGSGVDQAVVLIDDHPIIPDIADSIDTQAPMKTIIVI